MARRDRGFPSLLAVVVTACFALGVTGFVSTTPTSRSGKISVGIFAKETEELPPTRRTRTLWKPDVSDAEVLAIEKEIRESTKARLDLQRVEKLLEDDLEVEEKAIAPDWQVSLAAGSVAGLLTVGTTENWALAMFALVSVYLIANGDPLEEQTPVGATARVVGRATLHSLHALQPKIKAVARVALRGDDKIALLTDRIEQLEAENEKLRLWQKRRNAVDNSLSKYTLTQLKKMARENDLAVGGSKTTLLMRLAEADVLEDV